MWRTAARIWKVCLLLSCAAPFPAQDRPSPAGPSGPAGLSIERLKAPPELTSLVSGRRWGDLLRYAARGLAGSPDDRALYYWMGVAQFHLRNFVPAVCSLRSAEKLGLGSAPLHEALGLTYYAIHQYRLFSAQMAEAIQADPADPLPYHYLGRYYEHDLNDYPKAISYFDQALKRQPEDFKSLYFRAFCLQLVGNDADARAGYEAAIRQIEAAGALFGWPYQKMAELLLPADPAAAWRYARKAVQLEPAVDANHLILAKACERLGNLDAAIQESLQAARLAPHDPSIHYLLFRLYKKKGDAPNAAAELKLHQKLRAVYAAKQ